MPDEPRRFQPGDLVREKDSWAVARVDCWLNDAMLRAVVVQNVAGCWWRLVGSTRAFVADDLELIQPFEEST